MIVQRSKLSILDGHCGHHIKNTQYIKMSLRMRNALELSGWHSRRYNSAGGGIEEAGKRKWHKSRPEDNQFGSGIVCVAHLCAAVAGSWIAIVSHFWVAAISGSGIAVVVQIGSVVLKIHTPKMFICLVVLANTTPLAEVRHHRLRVLRLVKSCSRAVSLPCLLRKREGMKQASQRLSQTPRRQPTLRSSQCRQEVSYTSYTVCARGNFCVIYRSETSWATACCRYTGKGHSESSCGAS